jgi:hypothetical protein
MQLPEKYKDNFNVLALRTTSNSRRRAFARNVLGSCIPTNESLFIWLVISTLAKAFHIYYQPAPYRSGLIFSSLNHSECLTHWLILSHWPIWAYEFGHLEFGFSHVFQNQNDTGNCPAYMQWNQGYGQKIWLY